MTTAPIHVTLRDDISIELRRATLADRDGLGALFARMGALSVRHRYFEARNEPDLRWLDRSRERELAVVAVACNDARIVGLARCIEIAPQIAEVAFEVGDADQHRGIGTALLAHVARMASSFGISTLRADVESDNSDMLGVFAHSGYAQRRRTDRDGCHVELSLGARTTTTDLDVSSSRVVVDTQRDLAANRPE
jgi:GNAT superfamily N-acetyltransferase